ncbi:hypothetical protein Misp01_06080 [Microtetraspora sp. NBRC 13810]|uniref:DUF917 domain-containing protein n=1 Tax=Microtetraspora sp. NBRC 13810 TaxID=3030990 RepID=UPI00249FDAE0|nr:DUF917 domain-containing protein [Microtetraspora sp. NBRC 13810]GLW05478.1 hypothetical protein Misp01_06080 [Microtetraspora sp. NBRC 13810]
MRIAMPEVAALERGVSLLGSGGGGDTITAAALLRRQLAAGREITVTSCGELPPSAGVAPVGVVGATAVFTEKLPGGGEFRAAVAAMERWTGTPVAAAVSIEIGGLNGIIPLVAAADLGLATVDADLSGRGVPRLDQLSVAAVGRGLTPAVLAEPGGQVVLIDGGSAAEVERAARVFLAGTGGWAALVLAPVPAGELPGCAVLGTLGGALSLGRRALAAGENPDPAALAAATGGRVLALGRVAEVSRRLGPARYGRAGFGRGSVTVEDHATKELLRLEMENEYLLALRDGTPVASTPDILAVLDRRTGAPILCDVVRHGVEVAVLQLPAAPFWTDPARLPVLAPRAFGIDADPVLLPAAGGRATGRRLLPGPA